MKSIDVKLWVQSDNPEKPDLLSINGEKINPGDVKWKQSITKLLNPRNYGVKLSGKEFFSLYKKYHESTIMGVLSQCDISDRQRVFITQVRGLSTRKALTVTESELARYGLDLSNRCKSEKRKFYIQSAIISCALLIVVFTLVIYLLIR